MKGKDAVVKVDAGLLKEVEEFISRKESRFRYANKKQLINVAIIEFLNSQRLDKNNKKRKYENRRHS